MGDVVVLLPRHATGHYVMQEECCWQWTSDWTPGMTLQNAGRSAAMGQEVKIRDAMLRMPGQRTEGLPPAWRYEMAVTWPYGEELWPLVVAAAKASEQPPTWWANPMSTASALQGKVPRGVCRWPHDHFSATQPLPLDAVSEGLWATWKRVLYQLSSGCPWSCKFCHWAGQRLRRRDADLAVVEIAELLRRVPEARTDRGGWSVSLLCNEITGRGERHMAWLTTLLEGLEAMDIRWRTDANVRTMTREQVAMLAAAGCADVTLGIEFLEDGVLRRLGKGHTVEEAFEAMRWLQDAGIKYHFQLRQGVGETEADLAACMMNLLWMREWGLEPLWVRPGPMVEWPGQGWIAEMVGGEREAAAGREQEHEHEEEGVRKVERVNVGSEGWPRWVIRLTAGQKRGWVKVAERLEAYGWLKGARRA